MLKLLMLGFSLISARNANSADEECIWEIEEMCKDGTCALIGECERRREGKANSADEECIWEIEEMCKDGSCALIGECERRREENDVEGQANGCEKGDCEDVESDVYDEDDESDDE